MKQNVVVTAWFLGLNHNVDFCYNGSQFLVGKRAALMKG
jgi:hypothetical protein